jgi:hypothetical protein
VTWLAGVCVTRKDESFDGQKVQGEKGDGRFLAAQEASII